MLFSLTNPNNTMSETLDLKALCKQCVEIARDAGQEILNIYDSEYSIEEKEDKSPLTDADLAAHNTIVKQLTELTPDIPVLSEESAKLPFEERQSRFTASRVHVPKLAHRLVGPGRLGLEFVRLG